MLIIWRRRRRPRRGFVLQAQAAQQRLKQASAPPSYGQVPSASKARRRVLFSSAHLPSVRLLLRQRRVAAGNGALCRWSWYEHSEQARAPHTNGPRDVPRCGALSLLQKTLHYKGEWWWCSCQLFAAALVVRRRYFIVAPRPFSAAPLVVHRRCWAVVPMPMPEAPRMYLRS